MMIRQYSKSTTHQLVWNRGFLGSLGDGVSVRGVPDTRRYALPAAPPPSLLPREVEGGLRGGRVTGEALLSVELLDR